jgi:hypothetical protein
VVKAATFLLQSGCRNNSGNISLGGRRTNHQAAKTTNKKQKPTAQKKK